MHSFNLLSILIYIISATAYYRFLKLLLTVLLYEVDLLRMSIKQELLKMTIL